MHVKNVGSPENGNMSVAWMQTQNMRDIYLSYKTQTSPTSQETTDTHFAFCKNMHKRSNPGTGYGIRHSDRMWSVMLLSLSWEQSIYNNKMMFSCTPLHFKQKSNASKREKFGENSLKAFFIWISSIKNKNKNNYNAFINIPFAFLDNVWSVYHSICSFAFRFTPFSNGILLTRDYFSLFSHTCRFYLSHKTESKWNYI